MCILVITPSPLTHLLVYGVVQFKCGEKMFLIGFTYFRYVQAY